MRPQLAWPIIEARSSPTADLGVAVLLSDLSRIKWLSILLPSEVLN